MNRDNVVKDLWYLFKNSRIVNDTKDKKLLKAIIASLTTYKSVEMLDFDYILSNIFKLERQTNNDYLKEEMNYLRMELEKEGLQ